MEQLKSLDELTEMDEKHRLMGAVCGGVPSLEKMHDLLSQEHLNHEVPDEIKGQFNVARNMALYSYYFYALAPEVHLKTYTVIEHALKLKAKPEKHMMLGKLLRIALQNGWISDAGFGQRVVHSDAERHSSSAKLSSSRLIDVDRGLYSSHCSLCGLY